ncbi:hypothetical protein F5883DRAFT_549177 [Diaporthe sp. PMI_573]|nr:hypothetical protein F5883DRAFT_549177 [Diaporthaceae sp. PMI_573]
MFHMDQLIRSRKVIRDVTYKWIPFLFVILTIVVSTALLSTSGHPPRGIVVTFAVFAGLLVFIFLLCHLMMYCTRIKHEMDTERANGDKDDADPSSRLNKNIPPGFLTAENDNTQAQQRGRDQPEQHGPGRDEQQRQSGSRPNHRMSSNAPNRSPTAHDDAPGINQVAGYGSDRPRLRNQEVNRVHQQDRPSNPHRTPRDSYFRHSSARPDPLDVPGHQTGNMQQQQQSQPGLAGEESLTRSPHSRHTSGGDGGILHSVRTSAQTETAEPPPHEAPRRHHAAARDVTPREMLQHSARNSQHHSRISAAEQMEREMYLPGPQNRLSSVSAHSHLWGDQAEHRGSPTNRPDNVQARVALLGSPDVWGFASRLLPDLKPGARLRRMSADDCLRRPPWRVDDADLTVLRDIECKVANVRPAAPGLERIQSQKGSVRIMRPRDSNDSGYYSAGSIQHAPPLPLPSDLPTAFSATSISSPGSTWPAASSGSPFSSSPPSVRSELLSLRRRSASSMASEWMGWRGRASMGHDGAISVITRTRVRYGRQRPLGWCKTC